MRVDVRGEICPYPMLKAVEAMKKAKPNEIVEVLTDHAPALETIPTQASRLGFSIKIEEVRGGEWRIALSRQAQAR